MLTKIPLLLSLLTPASARIISIIAKDFAFDPEIANAAVGDILEFHFLPRNHSVAMGDFDNPCQPAATGGFFSGFLPAATGENSQTFRVTINDTSPHVFYCTQGDHCTKGMVGVVNADSGMLEKYRCGASSIAEAVSPPAVFGGVLAPNGAETTSCETSSATSTAATTEPFVATPAVVTVLSSSVSSVPSSSSGSASSSASSSATSSGASAVPTANGGSSDHGRHSIGVAVAGFVAVGILGAVF
ncbi:Cupredoxin [Lasiosphaeris hirsuta]|uniref:Cupredoxin n=1 Tax=Lasiosphaeris hirsuta TaxID=260670 RepID=A0AA40AFA7_9PEZI|nr:Cupredoxin [Lasiosphaeris hirsuta]